MIRDQGWRKRSVIGYQGWEMLKKLAEQNSLLKLGSTGEGLRLVKKRTSGNLTKVCQLLLLFENVRVIILSSGQCKSISYLVILCVLRTR